MGSELSNLYIVLNEYSVILFRLICIAFSFSFFPLLFRACSLDYWRSVRFTLLTLLFGYIDIYTRFESNESYRELFGKIQLKIFEIIQWSKFFSEKIFISKISSWDFPFNFSPLFYFHDSRALFNMIDTNLGLLKLLFSSEKQEDSLEKFQKIFENLLLSQVWGNN